MKKILIIIIALTFFNCKKESNSNLTCVVDTKHSYNLDVSINNERQRNIKSMNAEIGDRVVWTIYNMENNPTQNPKDYKVTFYFNGVEVNNNYTNGSSLVYEFSGGEFIVKQ